MHENVLLTLLSNVSRTGLEAYVGKMTLVGGFPIVLFLTIVRLTG